MLLQFHKGDNIKDFCRACRLAIANFGSVVMTLEPGDATRYELVLVYCGEPGSFCIAAPEQGWSALIGDMPVLPYLQEKLPNTLPWTVHLVCDLIWGILQVQTGQFYDWQKAEPIIRRE